MGQPTSWSRCSIQVHGTSLATYQIRSSTKKSPNRRVAYGLLQLVQNLCLNAATQMILAIRIERRKAKLGASAGYENLILGHVSRRRVMFRMGYTPRVVWNPETDSFSVSKI